MAAETGHWTVPQHDEQIHYCKHEHTDIMKLYRDIVIGSLTAAAMKKKQQRVAVGPENAHFFRQVSSDAVTLRRCTCGPPLLLRLPLMLLCIANLPNKS